MRVMLVYSNRTRILEPAPPIGLSYVATAVRQAGHQVRFVDLMISPDPLTELRTALREFSPEVVGFSVRNIDNVVAQRTSWHLDEVSELIATVRAESKAQIVLGGPAASILGKTALERLNADFVIVGEGEVAMPKLLSALQGSRDFEGISGLCYRNGKDIRAVEPVRQNSFGWSGMEQWVQWRAYERAGGAWAVHTKRGCPLTCIYCNYPAMEGHSLRRRTASDVVDEIERVMVAVGPRTFEFTDSTFNVPESHAIQICEEIIRRNLQVNLSAVGVNPLTVSEKLFALMKQAGFCSLVITPDSASGTMLQNLHKGFGVDQVKRTAQMARDSGIRCTWFFLLGGPGETNETAEETISFVEENLNWKRFLTIFMTGIRILPGTDLAKRAVADGYITAENNLCEPVFYMSPAMDEEWVLQRINRAIARCPTIVHGAEENGSALERVFNQSLYWLGAAPPYYRFLPAFLRIPPLPTLRARNTNVHATSRKPSCGERGDGNRVNKPNTNSVGKT
jgi:radical SAM superfamily enzyme YgiQ (UPF0313 family)